MRKLKRKHIRPGGWAWIGMAGTVFVMDYLLIANGKATMSEVFGDALKHPAKRWPVVMSWGILSLHLFGNILPRMASPIKRLDPIGAVARVLTPTM